jgi:hypothetical protein
VLLHVIAAFTFALARLPASRGGSAASASFRGCAVRSIAGRDRRHVRLDGRVANRWRDRGVHRWALGQGRIWSAIVLLLVMFAAMYARASTWFGELSCAAGQEYFRIGKGAQPAERPDAILWPKVMKPF